MSLCAGCQKLVGRLLDRFIIWKGSMLLHANFIEFCDCADAVCDLCKYLRHEMYRSEKFRRWIANQQGLQAGGSNIIISGPLLPERTLYVGRKPSLHFITDVDDVENIPHSWERRRYEPTLSGLLQLCRSWLTTCSAEHGICCPQTDDKLDFMPTRLLDLGRQDEDSIRLVLSQDFGTSNSSSYVTLSYCWGKLGNAVCTTEENISERLRGIAVNTLPQTLQDAVYITRAFGVKYLWVGALCILQVKKGENKDWQRELPSMGKIYKHSLFTIAASSAQDSSAGIFRPDAACSPVQDYQLPPRDDSHGFRRAVLFASVPDWDIAVERSPLANRGWVLQERYLASRTLFWTDDGLFWECNGARIFEKGYMIRDYSDLSAFSMLAHYIRSEHHEAHNRWADVLEEYSRKKLTVPTDRLPAIEGLMRELSRVTGEQYDTGVWKNNVCLDLAWKVNVLVDEGQLPPVPERLPGVSSWSWASVDQPIEFEPLVQVLQTYRSVLLQRLDPW